MKIENEQTNCTKGTEWIKQYNEFLTECQNRGEELSKELSSVDCQLDDILHFIEMRKYDAIVGARLMKKIKELRISRRYIKEELSALNSIASISKLSKYKNNPNYVFKTNVLIDLLGMEE